ncbi:MAG: TonB-dependent receptor, partial [bacterium]
MGKLKSTAILLGFSVSFSSINAMDFSQNDESQLSDFYGDDFFVSIATGVSQPINKAPAVASVITADEIVRTGATDLDQLLERIPGLHVARSIGFNPIYTFRGIHSNFNPQVLMLVNGIPLTHLYQGDRNLVWGGMPVEAISRVEVIRGPGSALYGADAFAGVINIILKQGSEITEASSGVRFGSFNSKSAWFVDGGTFRDADWSFSIQY